MKLSGGLLACGALIAVGAAFAGWPAARAEAVANALPMPAVDVPASGPAQTAVLSGGCFWGVQGVFEHVRGVRKVLAGYAGGSAASANYETVSEGHTGHAESVQVEFDPQQISYGRILQIFFSVALDPTEVNRQGPDVGTQYRSEIFTAGPEQAKAAVAYIAQLDQSHAFARPIATRVDPLNGFYPAETYHQDYLERHPHQPYIAYNDIPKVESLKRLFPEIYLDKPVLALQAP
ncbi:MAG TPA: peptide-methionine (S)-S-oxide reductase MsrA [Acetobacteraceae bacterium]|nr:peptide-methionine (S)-S-oxide reductase MsrA [Acetobacteraceae bacterium]